MIICDRFKGDFLFMQEIQHDQYWLLASTIFYKVKKLYLLAIRIMDAETQLGFDAKEITTFDNRALQYVHDVIATRFRFMNRIRLNQYVFPGVFSESSDDDFFADLWLKYFDRFLDWFYETYPECVTKVLDAAIYPNPDPRGEAAEEFLYTNMKRFQPREGMLEHEWKAAYGARNW